MDKILVTGGAGYIGSILVRKLLELNYEVTVIDNLFYKQNTLIDCCSYNKFNFVKLDVNNHKELISHIKKNDVIIPLAAIVGAPAVSLNTFYSEATNFETMKAVSKHISKNQKIIFPTTNSGYGVGEKGKFCTEESELKPVSLYGKQKVELEKIYLKNTSSISLRLATVFGPSPRMRTDLLVNDFVLKAIRDKSVVLFEENFSRNYIHVDDVSSAFIFSLKNFDKMKNEAFNVGLSSANLTKKQLCLEIQKKIKFEIISSQIGKDPDKRDYIVSNEKIEKMGWKPKKTIGNGIDELIKLYSIINYNTFSNL